MDERIERALQDLAEREKPAYDKPPRHRSEVIERKGRKFMQRIVDETEGHVRAFNSEHAEGPQLVFARTPQGGFSVTRTTDRFNFECELDLKDEVVRVRTYRAEHGVHMDFALPLQIDADDNVILDRSAARAEADRMAALCWCILATIGTNFWVLCFIYASPT